MFTKVEPKPSFPELEKAVLKRWQQEHTFEQSLERTKDRPEFVFYDGPPFPTGSPHYGTIFVTFLFEPTFGHIDHFMTVRHREYVEKPIYEWAVEVFGH